MTLAALSHLLGWSYFFAWSFSFYPQLILNTRRKSVTGLSFDFVFLNVLGFICYFLYSIGLFSSSAVRQEYRRRNHGHNPGVALNDIAFALHALILASATAFQTLIYERGPHERVSNFSSLSLTVFVAIMLVGMICSITHHLKWLDYFYVLSYIKLYISFAKYIPQAWKNFKRQSTDGWSIENILLDFTGGALSIAQLFVDAARDDNVNALFINPAKLLLGLLSIGFDVLFMVQHYILYRQPKSISFIVDEDVERDQSRAAGEDTPLLR